MNIGDSDILYSFDRARLIDRARNGFMRIDGLTFKRARDYMAKYSEKKDIQLMVIPFIIFIL